MMLCTMVINFLTQGFRAVVGPMQKIEPSLVHGHVATKESSFETAQSHSAPLT